MNSRYILIVRIVAADALAASARARSSAEGNKMTRNSKLRLGCLCILALSYTGLALGQSLDAGLPSAQSDGSVSSRPQAADSGGESVNAAIHPFAQGDLPNVQVNSDVTENAVTNVESERGPSPPSSTAIRMLTSITGSSTGQRESYRGHAEIRPVNRPRSSRESRSAGGVPRRGALQRISGKMQAGNEPHIIATDITASGATGATYQGDFPDSTQRATLASPPDPGTESPLAWSPGLSVGLRNIQTTQFLNPSLRAPHRRRSRRGSLGRNRAWGEAHAGPASADQDLNLDPGRQMPDTLSQPALLSPLSTLDQQLNPDLNPDVDR